jgi:hypothetical protein
MYKFLIASLVITLSTILSVDSLSFAQTSSDPNTDPLGILPLLDEYMKNDYTDISPDEIFNFFTNENSPYNEFFSQDSPVADPIEINLSPSHPQPHETYTASINDYTSILQGARITWTLNGEIVETAFNQRQINLQAGSAGETQNLAVTFHMTNGQQQIFRKTIKPMYLDIIIEPQTRTPHFYQGRAVPSIGSVVNATAIVDGKLGDSQDYIYLWKIEQDIIGGGTIRGTNQTTFTMPQGDTAILSVTVTEPSSGVVVAKRTISVPSVTPELYLYENSPLYGLSDIAITDRYIFVGNNATLHAEPYFLDIKTYNNPDLAEWKIGNEKVSASTDPYKISLQRNNFSGTSRVTFHVRSFEEFLQGVEKDFRINF